MTHRQRLVDIARAYQQSKDSSVNLTDNSKQTLPVSQYCPSDLDFEYLSDSDDEIFYDTTSSDLSNHKRGRRHRKYPLKIQHGEVIDSGVPTSNLTQQDTGSLSSLNQDSSDNFDHVGGRCKIKPSIVDGLLCEIYDRYTYPISQRNSVDSDSFTECSSTSDAVYLSVRERRSSLCCYLADFGNRHSLRLHRSYLNTKDVTEIRAMLLELQHRIQQTSSRLVKLLKRKDRRTEKFQKNCDILTAILQAVSQKRRVDTRMKFNLEPMPGKKGFKQWHDALRAMARMPNGIPNEWRKKIWLRLADHHIKNLTIDWEKTLRFAFNERSNPDDDKLGVQIVKDLHRTGCSGYSGQDAEQDRIILKRVLLAYARWNKTVGYCQGFNVLAALILEVVDHVEDDALKVMIYLIDSILPQNYFANNLRALSVDMAVFRDLLRLKLPELSIHLDQLQRKANEHATGNNYEPPLTNVFTMQWFLTVFATCLPQSSVLRVWDSLFLEGSQILLRTAIAIWAKLGERIAVVNSADEFYTTMGTLTHEMLNQNLITCNELIQTIYSMAPFPFPNLNELREKYTYNITPFSPFQPSGGGSTSKNGVPGNSDDDLDGEDDDALMLTCFDEQNTSNDIRNVSPGAYGSIPENVYNTQPNLERMSTDISALKKQYSRIRQRQQQVHVIYMGARMDQKEPKEVVNPIKTSVAINHLFLARNCVNEKNQQKYKQRAVPLLQTQHQAINHLQIQPCETELLSNVLVQKCSQRRTSSSRKSSLTPSPSLNKLSDYKSSSENTRCLTNTTADSDNLCHVEPEDGSLVSVNGHVPFHRSFSTPNAVALGGQGQLELGQFDWNLSSSSLNGTLSLSAQTSLDSVQDGRHSTPHDSGIVKSMYVDDIDNNGSKVKVKKNLKVPNYNNLPKPNLATPGSERPRIYNPFPVRYIHNTKMRNGLKLGLYSPAISSNKSIDNTTQQQQQQHLATTYNNQSGEYTKSAISSSDVNKCLKHHIHIAADLTKNITLASAQR